MPFKLAKENLYLKCIWRKVHYKDILIKACKTVGSPIFQSFLTFTSSLVPCLNLIHVLVTSSFSISKFEVSKYSDLCIVKTDKIMLLGSLLGICFTVEKLFGLR